MTLEEEIASLLDTPMGKIKPMQIKLLVESHKKLAEALRGVEHFHEDPEGHRSPLSGVEAWWVREYRDIAVAALATLKEQVDE